MTEPRQTDHDAGLRMAPTDSRVALAEYSDSGNPNYRQICLELTMMGPVYADSYRLAENDEYRVILSLAGAAQIASEICAAIAEAQRN